VAYCQQNKIKMPSKISSNDALDDLAKVSPATAPTIATATNNNNNNNIVFTLPELVRIILSFLMGKLLPTQYFYDFPPWLRVSDSCRKSVMSTTAGIKSSSDLNAMNSSDCCRARLVSKLFNQQFLNLMAEMMHTNHITRQVQQQQQQQLQQQQQQAQSQIIHKPIPAYRLDMYELFERIHPQAQEKYPSYVHHCIAKIDKHFNEFITENVKKNFIIVDQTRVRLQQAVDNAEEKNLNSGSQEFIPSVSTLALYEMYKKKVVEMMAIWHKFYTIKYKLRDEIYNYVQLTRKEQIFVSKSNKNNNFILFNTDSDYAVKHCKDNEQQQLQPISMNTAINQQSIKQYYQYDPQLRALLLKYLTPSSNTSSNSMTVKYEYTPTTNNQQQQPQVFNLKFKICIVGDGGVGKTSLAGTIVNGQFPEYYNYMDMAYKTMAIKFKDYGQQQQEQKQQAQVEVSMFDTAGQSDYVRLRPLSYPDTDLFLVCFAFDMPDSLENVSLCWVPEVESTINAITQTGGSSSYAYASNKHKEHVNIILVGLKSDVKSNAERMKQQYNVRRPLQKVITTQDAIEVAKKMGCIGYMEASAKDASPLELERFFEDAVLATLMERAKRVYGVYDKSNSQQCCTM